MFAYVFMHMHTHTSAHLSDIYWAGPAHFYLFQQKQLLFIPPLRSLPPIYTNNPEGLS